MRVSFFVNIINIIIIIIIKQDIQCNIVIRYLCIERNKLISFAA